MGLITCDVISIFLARCLRNAANGGVAVIFYLLLWAEETALAVAIATTCIFLGDTIIAIGVTTKLVPRVGRRYSLMFSALLFITAGVAFAFTDLAAVIAVVGAVGIISPAGGELGPFVSIEQAILADVLERNAKTAVDDEDPQARASRLAFTLGLYQTVGSLACAAGALATGFIVKALQDHGHDDVTSYRMVYWGYIGIGFIMLVLYILLSPAAEFQQAAAPGINDGQPATAPVKTPWNPFAFKSKEVQKTVVRLSALFALDAFAGGLAMQSYISWWFHRRWGMEPHLLGTLIMSVNIVGGLSGLVAGKLVTKFGAVNTMVFTHLPSNILLMAVVFMPSMWSAAAMMLARYCISQMDVPARQAYVAAVVPAAERTAGNGVTNGIRSVGVAIAPILLAVAMNHGDNDTWIAGPFIIAGILKCIYDGIVYLLFQMHVKATEEKKKAQADAEAESERAPLIASGK